MKTSTEMRVESMSTRSLAEAFIKQLVAKAPSGFDESSVCARKSGHSERLGPGIQGPCHGAAATSVNAFRRGGRPRHRNGDDSAASGGTGTEKGRSAKSAPAEKRSFNRPMHLGKTYPISLPGFVSTDERKQRIAEAQRNGMRRVAREPRRGLAKRRSQDDVQGDPVLEHHQSVDS